MRWNSLHDVMTDPFAVCALTGFLILVATSCVQIATGKAYLAGGKSSPVVVDRGRRGNRIAGLRGLAFGIAWGAAMFMSMGYR